MSQPFGQATISLGIYVDPAEPAQILERTFAQARLADEIGIDGVTISEHHAGFPSYVPNPLQVAGWILDRTKRVWAGPNPLLLPLRPGALVAEELAWLAALHPGRVGAGFAPGYVAADFEAYGLDFESRGRCFGAQLPQLAAALSGRATGGLAHDPAIAVCTLRQIPLVATAGSITAAQRAAAAGVGILTDSLATEQRLRTLFSAYADAGGAGARCITRRIWIGQPPEALVDAQAARYEAAAPAGSWLSGSAIRLESGSPLEVGERLGALVRAVDATHVALKVHLLGVTHDQSMQQIAALGDAVPLIRAGMEAGE